MIITHSIHIQLFYSYSSFHSIHHIQSSHNQSVHLIIHSRDSNQFLSFHITINQTSILPFLNQFKLIQQTISTTYYVPSVPFVWINSVSIHTFSPRSISNELIKSISIWISAIHYSYFYYSIRLHICIHYLFVFLHQ